MNTSTNPDPEFAGVAVSRRERPVITPSRMRTKLMVRVRIAVILAGAIFVTWSLITGVMPEQVASAQGTGPLASLRTVPIAEPSNLADFIKDRDAAIRLGKALFWDQQLGSDSVWGAPSSTNGGGVSCASCHFQAGADSRSKNQISPGMLRTNPDGSPNPDVIFFHGGPNYELTADDFPLRKLTDPNDRNSTVLRDNDDVVSSAGVFGGSFATLAMPLPDDFPFNIASINVRRVEPRNTPTVINAVFNFRQFWDGRAQNDFNGVNPFGARDPSAQVVKALNPNQLEQIRISLTNASLASQAVGPPENATEQGFGGLTFKLIGRKMLSTLLTPRPLARQKVAGGADGDSVLGSLSRSPNKGLNTTYAAMIQTAFKNEWWQSNRIVKVVTERTQYDTDPRNDCVEERLDDVPIRGADGSLVLRFLTTSELGRTCRSVNEYKLMEYNFSLFFGLAVQMYEATLVSDQTSFDQFMEGDITALTTQQQEGLALFSRSRCVACHGGPELTNASVSNAGTFRLFRRPGTPGNLIDQGFFNIGVRPTFEDLGIGGTDPFGSPLSDARRAMMGQFFDPNLIPALSSSEIIAVDGAFKAPGLRNVELTAPYFHNGGQLTLRQVIDFYGRGGDFQPAGREGAIIPLRPLSLTEEEKEALVAFLRALTDERVRYHRAPFDHPELFIPNGHPGGATSVTQRGSTGIATDSVLTIQAVGRSGYTTPPRSFLAP